MEAGPEHVFGYFTDPERMVRWMGTEATLDPRSGGVFRVVIDGQYVASGHYVEVIPDSRVSFTWGWEGEVPSEPGSSTVEVDLLPDGDATIVRLTHRGLPEEAREIHGHGWDRFLPLLAEAVAASV